MLSRVEGNGDARVEAVRNQILWRGLEEAPELAAAQHGVALVHKDHSDVLSARGAHLIGQLASFSAQPCLLVEVEHEEAIAPAN